MATLFASDRKIATSLLPFSSMRQNPSPAFFSKLREDVGKLVPQRAIDFVWKLGKPRIQRNEFQAVVGSSGGSFQTRVPFDANPCRNSICA